MTSTTNASPAHTMRKTQKSGGGIMSNTTFRPNAFLSAFVKPPIKRLIPHLPDPLDIGIFVMREYHSIFGCYPHILFPRTFNEKLQVRKLFDRRRQLSIWADKYLAREYVRHTLGPAVLPTLYHVTFDPSDIPFERLPTTYVVKPTHGSGWTYIVRDGSCINQETIINTCKSWLSTSFFALNREWIYKHVTPRILIEEFLDNGTGTTPNDYKFFVFDGKVQFIQVDVDRYTEHRRNLYDSDWNRLDCRYRCENCDTHIPKPNNLATMIDYAQRLAGDVDFVRVDLYEVRDKVYFGELTSTPANGFGKFAPASWDRTFGDLWTMRMRQRINCCRKKQF